MRMSSICMDCLRFYGRVQEPAVAGTVKLSRVDAAQTGGKVRKGLKMSSDCNFLLISERKGGGFDKNRLVRI